MKRLAAAVLALGLISTPALADEPAGIPALYAKEISGNKLKVYAKDIVGVGKVQILVNGKEIAWVRATEHSDPKLRLQRGKGYLVRTVTLRSGLNRIEILINSDLAWSRDYRK